MALTKTSNPIDKTLSQKKLQKEKNLSFLFKLELVNMPLYRFYNYRRNVYSLLILMYGKIFDKTHKVGLGLYMRHYTNNYKYIKEGNNLVSEEYPESSKKSFFKCE